MNDNKRVLFLFLFIIGIGFITYYVCDNIKENNHHRFIKNEIRLGDTNCKWIPDGASQKKATNTGCISSSSSAPVAEKDKTYCVYVELNGGCGNNSKCYQITSYKALCTEGSSTTTTKKDLGESCSTGTDCTSGYCSGGKCVCPAGKYKDGSNCVTCTEGHYCPGGNNQSPCDAGTSSSPGAKYKNECMMCADGYISKAGGKCERCPNGEKSTNNHTKCEKTSDTSYCNEGYYHANGSTNCTPCPDGKWSNGAKATTCYGCPTGSYCSNGVIKKCKAGTSSFNGATESDCKTCDKGYISSEGSYCRKCDDGYTSNSNHTSCYKIGSSSPSSPKDKCYKDTNNNYVTGNFNNQPGYTLVSNDITNCNNIKVKKVDSNKTILTGATIEFVDTLNPLNKKTFNIGETDISMTVPGTYTITETVAPTGYQVDPTPLQVVVNSDGTINITGGTKIDLGTTNGTRNIELYIINDSGGTVTPVEEEKCYIKRGMGVNNEYCYGKTSDKCMGFSEVVTGRTSDNCEEEPSCYQSLDGTYSVGKFYGQTGYQYIGTTCPACYEDVNGTYRWTNTPAPNEKLVETVTMADNCVTPKKVGSKLIYIVLIVVILAVIFIVLKSMKKGNGQSDMNTEY